MSRIECYGNTTRLQQLCRNLPYGQRVFVVEYSVNGEKERIQLNENYFKAGHKAGIGSIVVLDPKQESLHESVYNGLKKKGLLIDDKTGYKVVDVGLLIETNPHRIIFKKKEISNFIKGAVE